MQIALLGTLLLLCLTTSCTFAYTKCEKEMHTLSDMQMFFVQCTIINAVPVTFCTGCKNRYDSMLDAYEAIANNCTEEYFNHDRIAVMATMQSTLKGVWTKGFCDDCFKDPNTTATFHQFYTEVETCLTTHTINTCSQCMDDYMNLNTYFITLDQHNDGKVCYDMQDQMNRTRLKWSKDLKCCQREKNMTLFLVVTGIIAFFPVAFYGGTFLLTKRNERNHGLLNEQTPELGAPSTSALISAAVIATTPPTVPPPPLPVAKKLSPKTIADCSDSDSDDDVPVASKKATGSINTETDDSMVTGSVHK